MRGFLGCLVLIASFHSLSFRLFAEPPFSNQTFAQAVRKANAAEQEKNSLLQIALEAMESNLVTLRPSIEWDDSLATLSTQVVLFHVFRDLIETDDRWKRFFDRTSNYFLKERRLAERNPTRDDLRDTFATALALEATHSLNEQYLSELKRSGQLLPHVVQIFDQFKSEFLQYGIFQNWDLTVVHGLSTAIAPYRGELAWIVEMLCAEEQGIRIHTAESLAGLIKEKMLAAGLSKDAAETFSRFLIQARPRREKDFLDEVNNRFGKVAGGLGKPRLREIYKMSFAELRALLVNHSKVLALKIEERAAAKRLADARADASINFGVLFEAKLKSAAGEAEQLKHQRRRLTDLAIDLYLEDQSIDWVKIANNSNAHAFIIFVVQKMYANKKFREVLAKSYDLSRIEREIISISVKLRKGDELRVETKLPIKKCEDGLSMF